MGVQQKESWFKRHPRTTLSLVLLMGSLIMLYGTEKICWIFNKIEPMRLRCIRLKEYPPFFKQTKVVGREQLKYSDNLDKETFVVRADENGFIFPSKRHDDPDLSIVFLGGSTTECAHNEEEYRFPYLVGILVEEKTGKKVNSYNCGVGGSNSLHSLNVLLNKVIPLQPEVVIMCHHVNDMAVLLYEKSYWSDNPHRSPIIIDNLYNLNLFNILRYIKYQLLPNTTETINRLINLESLMIPDRPYDEFSHIRNKKISINRDGMLGDFEKNLQTFINICKARGITPVVMTQANRFKDNPDEVVAKTAKITEETLDITYREFKQIYDSFNESIRKIGSANNVLVIDLDRTIPKDKKYMFDSMHYTDYGSRFAASVISEKLLKFLKTE